MALGAQPGQVLKQFLLQGSVLLLTGLVLGLIGTWAAGLAMRNLLFQITPMNVVVLATTSSVLVAVVLFALLMPALRAARIPPVDALRAE